ncbi:sirohydrochlorin chelatase [Pseudonocardia sp. GCM10023141]|uniref:sirohydrochlorin chelatase n=1 Tax=Pseudonocardia sp. GCM10023141 TaxID=3252653 RepID=UPI00360819C1
MLPPLIAVAHGSRDPRSAATVAALMQEVRAQRPDLDVRLAFLDLNAPRLPDVIAGVAADEHRRAVVVPLLLGHAFHARVDVPGEVRRAAHRHPLLDIGVAEVLGGDDRLEDAALDRLAAVTPLHDPRLGVVLAAIGSSHAPANAAVARIAGRWTRRFGWAGAAVGYATANGPSVADTIATLRRDGARRVAVAPWILAPGLLPDRIDRAAADHSVPVAAPLGTHPLVAATVLGRYDDAAAGVPRRAAG